MKKLFIALLLLTTVISIQMFESQTSANDVLAEERLVVTLGFSDSKHLPINGVTGD